MKSLLFIFALTLIISSCNKDSSDKKSVLQKKTKSTIFKGNDHNYKSDRTILIYNKIEHAFSQRDKSDTFYVYIKGKSITEGEVVFIIKNFEGIEIFKEVFQSSLLIGDGLEYGNNATLKEKEKYIKERIAKFFDEEYFKEPAIELDEPYDEDYSNKTIWEDIKSDQTAVGFFFLLGEEDGRKIAYSKKFKKVVLYQGCC